MASTRFSLSSNGHQPKQRRRAGIGRVALVAFVMLMLVLPLAGGRAFAADDELIILDDPQIEAIDDTLVDDAVFEEETPPAQLDEVDDPILDDPVLDPGDPVGPSDLYLNATLCPGDLDLWSVDYYGLAAACQGGHANGWELFVSDVNGTPFWQQVVADSHIPVTGLPANDYLVQVNDPAAGPVTMRVMCSADDMLGNDVIGPFEAPVGSQIASISIQGGLMYWCDVFIVNIGDQTGGTGEVGEVTIYLNKHVCPENIVSDVVYFLASVCHGQLPGVDFSFDNGSGGNWVATTDASSIATFGPVGTGAWTITETIPGGYGDPQVFCGYDDFLGNDVGTYEHPDMTGGAFSIDIPADAAVAFCDVYNHPSDSEGGSIKIFKYNCPDGFDATSQDVYDECGALVDGVQFNATGPNGYAAQTDTGDSIGGAVSFGGLDAGQYEVVETVPAGYAAYAVSCSSDTKQFVVQHEEDLTDTPTLGWDLADNEDIVCLWYNVPTGGDDDDSVDVFITKWGCPEGFSSDDHSELLAECGDEMEGIDFTAEHLASGTTATDDTGGQPARAAFTPWYTGESTISEEIPAGYGDPKVYCYVADDFGDVVPGYELAPYTATDGTIEMTIPTPPADDLYTVYCDWFNVPHHEDGTVTIHKWECPEGTPYDEDLAYYLDHCTEAMEGVDFEQGPHSGSKQTVMTDGSGAVTFPVDEGSDWSIEEIIPSGYGENPIAFCGWGGYLSNEFDDTVAAIDGFYNLGPNGGTTLRFDTYEGFGMDCNWFNFPYDHDSDVTIYKYTCPAGYDIHASDADPKSDCVELTNGVEFHLDTDGGAHDETTGDDLDGGVDFSDVGYGEMTLSETLPHGTIATWVTCQWYEDLGPYVYEGFEPYAPADGVGTHIDVELSEGDDLVCQWYNVPEQTWDGGELTITKYWCEGYVVNVETCELGAGVKFAVSPVNVATEGFFTETGPSGSVTLSVPGGWALAVEEVDYEWCKAVASNVDADGNVLIEAGEETTLTIYNCNADTGTKNPPVTKFPNTGSGSTANAAVAPTGDGLSMELLTMAGGLLQLGLVVASRTLRPAPAGMLAAVTNR